MPHVDSYVKHLIRHDASAVILVSGQPVSFRFPQGIRHTKEPVDHASVMRLVQELAPAAKLDELKRRRQTAFHTEAAGIGIDVSLEASTSGQLRVTIARAADASQEPAPLSERHIRHARAAQGAPGNRGVAREPMGQVALAPGEPKINRHLMQMVRLDASDLHLSTGVVPMVRIHGNMQVLEGDDLVTDTRLREMLEEIMSPRSAKQLEENLDADFAHSIEGLARFRVNVFVDRKGVGAVFRQIPMEIVSPETLGVPKKVLELCWLSKGLVLVTGPTGSGKSTTLASLVDLINKNRSDHIVTIEDPIEFVHHNQKCLVNQREVGTHTKSFKNALRAALREDPDVVLVGEMRDLETIAIAIETAETGHLVFGTLHTTSATSTVDRIIDQFPADEQAQIRTMLAESLRGVLAQVLCRKKDGSGRVAAFEVLLTNPAVSNLIREAKTYQLKSIMQTGRGSGMQTMNDDLMALVTKDVVAPEEAYIKSNNKAEMRDQFKRHGIDFKLE